MHRSGPVRRTRMSTTRRMNNDPVRSPLPAAHPVWMARMLDTLDRLCSRIAQVLLWVVGALILLMMVNVTADVLGRVLFHSPLYGTSEMVGNYYMIGLVFLTIPTLELRNQQIFVDLFYNMMARRWRRVALILCFALQIAFYAGLGYQSLIDAIEAMAKREVVEGYYRTIVWPGRYLLAVGFLMALVISALRLVQTIAGDPRITALIDPAANLNPAEE